MAKQTRPRQEQKMTTGQTALATFFCRMPLTTRQITKPNNVKRPRATIKRWCHSQIIMLSPTIWKTRSQSGRREAWYIRNHLPFFNDTNKSQANSFISFKVSAGIEDNSQFAITYVELSALVSAFTLLQLSKISINPKLKQQYSAYLFCNSHITSPPISP